MELTRPLSLILTTEKPTWQEPGTERTMPRSPISRRLGGYRKRLVHEFAMWRHRRRNARNERCYGEWIEGLLAAPPDVFLGPDLPSGGVRGHVRAIKEHSSLRVQLVPDEAAMGCLENFTADIRRRFMEFDPAGSPTVHSHVIPWFIQWCHLQQKRGLRWVHTHHNWYYPEFSRTSLEPWQKEFNEGFLFALRNADVALSVSRWQQDFLRREHHTDTAYLPNGVDVLACDRGDARRFRKQNGIVGPFVLYVGRNDTVKNPADFVRLAIALPELKFVMIGGGLTRKVLQEEWEVVCPGNLQVLGPSTHSQVQDAIAASSVLVVTSKREGLPTLVMEGMAQRKPVVVPDEAGCMEAIGNGDFGMIYQQGKIGDLAEKVEIAMADATIGGRARQRVLDEYDWRVVAPKLDAIYRGGVTS